MLDFVQHNHDVLLKVFKEWDQYPFNIEAIFPSNIPAIVSENGHIFEFDDGLKVKFLFPIYGDETKRVFVGQKDRPNAVSLTRDGYMGIEGLLEHAPHTMMRQDNKRGTKLFYLVFLL
jgi:hypothetical protein